MYVMPKQYIFLAILLIAVSCQKKDREIIYPESKKIEFSENIHGYVVEDSYRWLEDFTSEESLEWVKKQNDFTNTYIGKTKHKKKIKKYLKSIWETESVSIPYKVEDKVFYYFNDGNFQQSKLMIKDCLDCEERVLINPNLFSKDGTISLAGTSVSKDGKYIAYAISDGGSDWRTWKVMEIDSGEILPDEIKWAKFSNATWEIDSSGFY